VVQLVTASTGRRGIEDTFQLATGVLGERPRTGETASPVAGRPYGQERHQDEHRATHVRARLTNDDPQPRNHGPGEITTQEAVERLSVLSLLARWGDRCDVIEAAAHPRARRDRRAVGAFHYSGSAWSLLRLGAERLTVWAGQSESRNAVGRSVRRERATVRLAAFSRVSPKASNEPKPRTKRKGVCNRPRRRPVRCHFSGLRLFVVVPAGFEPATFRV
jgi:hypothetical protein